VLVPGRQLALTCTWDARLLDVDLVARVLRHIGATLEDPEAAWGAPTGAPGGEPPGAASGTAVG
jgi:hypothetical protein